MRLRLRFVRTSDGQQIGEALVTGAFASAGQDELRDFHHTSVGRFEVMAHGRGYELRGRGSKVQVDTYAMVDFGDVELHCTVLRARRDGSAVPGCCPRCDTPLRPEAMGGAYRTIATERLVCPLCEVQVLALSNAAGTLGFGEGGGGSWVRVVSPMACPKCSRAMTPATLSVAATTVSVEACSGCERVLLEPEDRRALELAAERA